jgi:hypothetical protein
MLVVDSTRDIINVSERAPPGGRSGQLKENETALVSSSLSTRSTVNINKYMFLILTIARNYRPRSLPGNAQLVRKGS